MTYLSQGPLPLNLLHGYLSQYHQFLIAQLKLHLLQRLLNLLGHAVRGEVLGVGRHISRALPGTTQYEVNGQSLVVLDDSSVNRPDGKLPP